jgi:phosphoadenosine phosphosulfate reductase
MYKLGFNRTGCLICCYQSDYTDLLIQKYYPLQWARWVEILKKNYELWGVKARLKFTIEEWLNGAWKPGTSKEYDIINQKPTKVRIKQLADLKGISEELAVRYFQRKCSCGKRLNSDEIAMFLKTNGRFEGIEDNRQYLCKKCFCEKEGITPKEYAEKVMRFRNQECKLF